MNINSNSPRGDRICFQIKKEEESGAGVFVRWKPRGKRINRNRMGGSWAQNYSRSGRMGKGDLFFTEEAEKGKTASRKKRKKRKPRGKMGSSESMQKISTTSCISLGKESLSRKKGISGE